MLANMTTDIHLLSTSLRLKKGQLVIVELATNQPGKQYYARPTYGQYVDYSILVDRDDFTLCDEGENDVQTIQ